MQGSSHPRRGSADWTGWVGLRASIAAALLLLLPALSRSAAPAKVFRAGAAISNITPPLGIGMRAGGFESNISSHVHDELNARCLVLDDGTTRIAFIICDLTVIDREIFDEAKRLIKEATGLPVENIVGAATHTHSAANIRASHAHRMTYPLREYEQFLARRMADGVRRAINQLEPARIAWGQTSLPGQVFNRRWLMNPSKDLRNPFGGMDRARMNPPAGSKDLIEPAGPTDPGVGFLSVQAINGRPIALLANYSLHYVGGNGPREFSADYFGAFAGRMEELLGAARLDPPFVGILSNGTSGDINNIDYRKKQERLPHYQKIRAVAGELADKIQEASRGLKFQDWVELKVGFRELELATRRPTPEQIAWAERMLSQAGGSVPYHIHEKIYAGRTMLMAAYPERINFPLHALRIGDLAIFTVPVEAFAEIGLTLKEKSPYRSTFTIGLANGYFGYLPTPRHHELGGYETWLGTNRMEPQASTKMVDALLELLGGLGR